MSADATISEEHEHHSVHAGLPDKKNRRISPWAWVPTVYFAQGLQYAIVIQLFPIVFFTMGVPQGITLFWVGLLQLPWTLKPLWGPLVDKYGTKRAWTYVMQFVVGAAFVATAFALIVPGAIPQGDSPWNLAPFMWASILFLAVLAFAAATHDIACDGYYMLGLSEKQQAFYVGVRSTLFRAALIFANGVTIWIAGMVQSGTGLPQVETVLRTTERAPVTAPVDASAMDAVFATEHWPQASEQAIQILPETYEGMAGDTGYVTVRLARPVPEGETRVVVLRLKDAQQGIQIPKDKTRLEFTHENWNTGVDIPVASDERQRGLAEDVIEASAGNIPFSWLVVCMICGVFFVTIAIYHKFVLPYPASDFTDATNRPPFIIPLLSLLITVGVPFVLAYYFMVGVGYLQDDIQKLTIGEVKHPGLQIVRESIEGTDAGEQVPPEEIMSVIQAMRAEKLARSADNLRAVLTLRRTLEAQGLLEHGETVPRLWDFIEQQREDPALYGNPFLRRALVQIKTLNDGELPDSQERLSDLIARARNDALDRLPEDADLLLDTLKAVENVYSGYVIPRLEKAADVSSIADEAERTEVQEIAQRFGSVPEEIEFGNGLPRDRETLDRIVAMAQETPSKLQVKGYNSFFTVGRLILLLLVGALILYIPPLWEPTRNVIYTLSDKSRIGFAEVFATFFQKPGMGVTLAFLLTFRLGEAQLAQLKSIFLLDDREASGLAMSLGEVAFTNSVVYLGALTVGGLLGGFLIAKYGLKAVIWWMVAFMHLPNLLYYFLAIYQPQSLWWVNGVVGFESFGYGFGFTAYLMVMILAAQGPYKTAHYALCTGAMALGYMVPGMWAGYLQELVGYSTFFLLVMVFTVPGVIFIPFLRIDPSFGKKDTTT